MLVCVSKVGSPYFNILKHLELANKNEKQCLPTRPLGNVSQGILIFLMFSLFSSMLVINMRII